MDEYWGILNNSNIYSLIHINNLSIRWSMIVFKLIYVPSVKVDTRFVPTAAELRGITIEIKCVNILLYLVAFP